MKQTCRKTIWENHQEIWRELQNKKIFLTGGTGFFGKSFLDLILDFNQNRNLNLKVTILSRDPKNFTNKHSKLVDSKWIDFITGDVSDFAYPQIRYDYVLHFATPASATLNLESPIEMFNTIIDGSRNVLNFAKTIQTKSVLLASSGAVYGKQPTELSHVPESYVGAPLTNAKNASYGEAKRAVELLGNLYADKYNFEHKIARCYAFVGPYLDPNGTFAIGNFIKNAIFNESILIKGDGTDLRSYMYSDDLVLSLLKILIFGKNKQPYNVGSDEAISIKELAELVASTLNPQLKIEILQQSNPSAPVNRYVPNVDLLHGELKIKPSITLEQAIRETAEYYKENLKT